MAPTGPRPKPFRRKGESEKAYFTRVYGKGPSQKPGPTGAKRGPKKGWKNKVKIPEAFAESISQGADSAGKLGGEPPPSPSPSSGPRPLTRREELTQQLMSAERLLKADEARTNLIPFVEFMMPDPRAPEDPNKSRYHTQYFHRAIAAALEEVEAGRLKRLILTLPPRHGKSQLTSRALPAWFMGRDPYRHLMFATYNEPFAEDFGRDVRAIIQSEAYKLVFPKFEFRQGSTAANRLQSAEGGLAAFVGRGGSITGRGADLLIIDDPIKDHVEAASETVRKDTWEWFNNTAMTRLMSDESCVIIIMTRWHEDDLVGRLTDPTNPHYNAEEAANWHIINIPAIANDNDVLGREPGQALWEKKFGLKYLQSIRARNPRGFSALYQQEPSPEDGDLFTKDMIRTYKPNELPKRLRIYAASDHAVKQKQENDFTCIIVVGVCEQGIVWLLDCWWKKARTDVVVEAMIDMMEKHRPLIWWSGKDHITGSIGPFLYKRMRERGVHCAISQVSERADKVQKAQPLIGRMSMGMLKFPSEAPWFSRALAELLKFPNAKFDDFVDTLAHIGAGLMRFTRPSKLAEDPASKAPKVGSFAWATQASRERKKREKQNELLRGM